MYSNQLNNITSWEDYKKEMMTENERAELDLRVAFLLELIEARKEKGISQKELEELSGVRQPVIARVEKGTSIPNLNTVLKILLPLGKTLKIVPLEK